MHEPNQLLQAAALNHSWKLSLDTTILLPQMQHRWFHSFNFYIWAVHETLFKKEPFSIKARLTRSSSFCCTHSMETLTCCNRVGPTPQSQLTNSKGYLLNLKPKRLPINHSCLPHMPTCCQTLLILLTPTNYLSLRLFYEHNPPSKLLPLTFKYFYGQADPMDYMMSWVFLIF